MEFDVAQFCDDRDAAMLSMDRAQIAAFARKWDVALPTDPDRFWASVHKSRTAILALPRAARLASKLWLEERNLNSMDDGDLSAEETADGAA